MHLVSTVVNRSVDVSVCTYTMNNVNEIMWFSLIHLVFCYTTNSQNQIIIQYFLRVDGVNVFEIFDFLFNFNFE